LRDISRMKGN